MESAAAVKCTQAAHQNTHLSINIFWTVLSLCSCSKALANFACPKFCALSSLPFVARTDTNAKENTHVRNFKIRGKARPPGYPQGPLSLKIRLLWPSNGIYIPSCICYFPKQPLRRPVRAKLGLSTAEPWWGYKAPDKGSDIKLRFEGVKLCLGSSFLFLNGYDIYICVQNIDIFS